MPQNIHAEMQDTRYFAKPKECKDIRFVVLFVFVCLALLTLFGLTVFRNPDLLWQTPSTALIIIPGAITIQLFASMTTYFLPLVSWFLFLWIVPWILFPPLLYISLVEMQMFVPSILIFIHLAYFLLYITKNRSKRPLSQAILQDVCEKTSAATLFLVPLLYAFLSFIVLQMTSHIIRHATIIAGEGFEESVIAATLVLALILCSTLRFVQRLALTGKYAAMYLQCPEHTQSLHRAITTSFGTTIAAALLSTFAVLLTSIVFSMNHFTFTLCIAYYVFDSEIEWTSLTHIAIFNTSFLHGVFQAYISPLLSDEYVLSMMPAIITLFSVTISSIVYYFVLGSKTETDFTELFLFSLSSYIQCQYFVEPFKAGAAALMISFAENPDAVKKSAERVVTSIVQPRHPLSISMEN